MSSLVAGAKLNADYKPVAADAWAKCAPQMVSDIKQMWTRKLSEFETGIEQAKMHRTWYKATAYFKIQLMKHV
jgi:hypothetical protein